MYLNHKKLGLYPLFKIAQNDNAKEIWQFGSTTDLICRKPNDIDIAIFIKNKHIDKLIKALSNEYPHSRIQMVDKYTKGGPKKIYLSPFHFAIIKEEVKEKKIPIFKSIKSGVCLWKNPS